MEGRLGRGSEGKGQGEHNEAGSEGQGVSWRVMTEMGKIDPRVIAGQRQNSVFAFVQMREMGVLGDETTIFSLDH